MSVPAMFWTSMVRVTSVPDVAPAGTAMPTVPFAVLSLPGATVIKPGGDNSYLRSLVACNRNVSATERLEAVVTVTWTEMFAPGSMLVTSAWA